MDTSQLEGEEGVDGDDLRIHFGKILALRGVGGPVGWLGGAGLRVKPTIARLAHYVRECQGLF
jgi:hypothetical protein